MGCGSVVHSKFGAKTGYTLLFDGVLIYEQHSSLENIFVSKIS